MTVPTFTLTGGQTVKLGCILPVLSFDYGPLHVKQYADGRQKISLRLSYYHDTNESRVQLPDSTNWRAAASPSIKRMYLNDQYGDCVIASKYHMEGGVSGNESGTVVLGTDQEVLSAYHKICGPGDNGCVITDVLDAWKSSGLSFNGVTKKIDDYVSVDWTNKQLVQAALAIFGPCGCVGINLPSAWTGGADGSTWDVTSTRSVGGHDVATLDYDANGVWIATWGGTRLITWLAFTSRKWVGEFEIALSPDWYSKGNLSPSGVAADRLKADLALLAQGTIPDIAPPPIDWSGIFP